MDCVGCQMRLRKVAHASVTCDCKDAVMEQAADKPSAVPTGTVRSDEVERFNRLAATWWNSAGPMRPLHVINTLRLGYVLEQIAHRFRRPLGELTGLRVADIGCGAGLMCEPLAARGAQVVGVDAAAKSIAAARLHADAGRLHIDYRVGAPDAALRDDDLFDVVLLLEVVEHVDNLPAFVRGAASHLRPGGLLLIATINRTPRSFITAIAGAEYIFRVLPRGTHRWAQFVRPAELQQAAVACGLTQHDLRGMGYLPVVHRAWWSRSVAVNYIASFGKASV